MNRRGGRRRHADADALRAQDERRPNDPGCRSNRRFRRDKPGRHAGQTATDGGVGQAQFTGDDVIVVTVLVVMQVLKRMRGGASLGDPEQQADQPDQQHRPARGRTRANPVSGGRGDFA